MEYKAVEAEIETNIGRERPRNRDTATNKETQEPQGRGTKESKGQTGMLANSQGKRMMASQRA